MMHRACSSIVEVPYCFSRSHVKFQGHMALKIFEFDPNWAFPDCNSTLNSPMAMKCCTKLETAKERCPIVFQGHPSNFKVTRYKTSPILTQIGPFRTIGRSQLSNPSDLPCLIWILNLKKIEVCTLSLLSGFPLLQYYLNHHWNQGMYTLLHPHKNIGCDYASMPKRRNNGCDYLFSSKFQSISLVIVCGGGGGVKLYLSMDE